MTNKKQCKVAYFSMEFAVDHRIPNYAGGLGVLAADYMMAMADMGYPGVGVSLIYHLHEDPKQGFDPEQFMKKLDVTTTIQIEGRDVKIGAYEYTVKGLKSNIPIYCLTTNLPENEPWDRDITRYLYTGHTYTRICQEAILGIGGARILKELGLDIEYYHMNEGHAAFLTLEVLKNEGYKDYEVKKKVRFTTHTPVPAGHDHFDYRMVHQILGDMIPWHIKDIATQENLSMTHLALNLSAYSNSVSEKHREVCEHMFPEYKFKNVTNGVHHIRWASPATKELLDKKVRGWKEDPSKFEKATLLTQNDMAHMREENKKRLVHWINQRHHVFKFSGPVRPDDYFEEDVLTIGFARRFVPYKRAALMFRDLDRLRSIGYKKLQVIFAGPAQADNYYAQKTVQHIRHCAEILRGQIKVVVIPEYNTDISSHMVTGCDAWLNNPILPREASGTSGMKAALNGGLNISIPDGWWIEGYNMEPKAGWIFGGIERYDSDQERDDHDAEAFYNVLSDVVDCYYNRHHEWLDRARHAMGLMAHFSAQRAIEEYDEKMWTP